ncbi:DMT family transporter [Marinactinospora thermotolerans]|uniref:Quaternary ammonium compound-resistance protein SugE n=1 Tax=Marinactinospora thermotolerans DSM 45154 TaxID=1122192 RepID=A0A1T4T5T7_9ACTN|nr:multidrug efflux SMR transporter [Marinactinospora thermotolerans]SKA35802.1 quaternary ammonium compound-resistance protein SugE [Marinactinospora thermotolerans DSM 45154]
MAWFVLIISALLEAVWATALGQSEGFTKLVPSLVFVAALIPGMATLAYVAKRIPMSTAYAVWAGLGAAFTVAWSMLTGGEPATALRLALLAGIVGSVVGLKLLKPTAPEEAAKTPTR